MEFLQTIKNTIHGWSEETRKFLAMAAMGIGILAFFSLWISSVSSRLVAIGPSAPAPVAAALPAANNFASLSDNTGNEDIGNLQAYNAPAPVAQDQQGYVQPQTPPAEPLAENSLKLAAPPSVGAPFAQMPPASNAPVAEAVPTPIRGVAETFAGLSQLFSRTTDEPSDTIEGRLRSVGLWLWSIALNIFAWVRDFLLWFGGWLYHRVSTLIAV